MTFQVNESSINYCCHRILPRYLAIPQIYYTFVIVAVAVENDPFYWFKPSFTVETMHNYLII